MLLKKLVRLANNVAPYDLARAVYGDDADDGYVEGKANVLRRDFLAWMSGLDDRNIRRLAILAAHDWRRGPLPGSMPRRYVEPWELADERQAEAERELTEQYSEACAAVVAEARVLVGALDDIAGRGNADRLAQGFERVADALTGIRAALERVDQANDAWDAEFGDRTGR